jgi:hypothetical protein
MKRPFPENPPVELVRFKVKTASFDQDLADIAELLYSFLRQTTSPSGERIEIPQDRNS